MWSSPAPLTPQRRQQQFLPSKADDLHLMEGLSSVVAASGVLTHGFCLMTDTFVELKWAIEEWEYDVSD